MEKFTQKWSVVALLEPVSDGYEFFWKDQPLHVTLAGVFASTKSGTQLSELLAELLAGVEPIEVVAGDDLYWGNNQENTVVAIEKSETLLALHLRVHQKLTACGATFNEPEHEGSGVILHSTVQKDSRLNKGETAQISSVSLVDMFPGGDGYRRKITKTTLLSSL